MQDRSDRFYGSTRGRSYEGYENYATTQVARNTWDVWNSPRNARIPAHLHHRGATVPMPPTSSPCGCFSSSTDQCGRPLSAQVASLFAAHRHAPVFWFGTVLVFLGPAGKTAKCRKRSRYSHTSIMRNPSTTRNRNAPSRPAHRRGRIRRHPTEAAPARWLNPNRGVEGPGSARLSRTFNAGVVAFPRFSTLAPRRWGLHVSKPRNQTTYTLSETLKKIIIANSTLTPANLLSTTKPSQSPT